MENKSDRGFPLFRDSFFTQIHFPRSFPAAQMSLGFIQVEHPLYPLIKLGVAFLQFFGDILMYRTLADGKMMRRGAHRCHLLDHIFSEQLAPLLVHCLDHSRILLSLWGLVVTLYERYVRIMIKEAEKFTESARFEGMTSIRAILRGITSGVNNRAIREILFASDRIDKIGKEIAYLKAVQSEYRFTLTETTSAHIDSLAIGTSHGGIVAECTERTFPALSEHLREIKPNGFYVMIEGIEDPYNFGYALRSLYACGVDGIILDKRNWMSAAGVVARSSAGASELFPIYLASPAEACSLFHTLAYKIVCADIRTEHLLEETDIRFPVFLIVGGERRGISRAVLDMADLKVRISYGREFRGSLSAASAATILGYEIFRQNRFPK